MNEDDILLLENNGWEVECESPFEIRTLDGSGFATGSAAYEILAMLKENSEEYLKEKSTYDQKIFEAKKVLYELLLKKCSNDQTENDLDLMYFIAKDVEIQDYFDNI